MSALTPAQLFQRVGALARHAKAAKLQNDTLELELLKLMAELANSNAIFCTVIGCEDPKHDHRLR